MCSVSAVMLRKALAASKPEPKCRQDGRCQYAIDHGAEGLGHCPPGKCAMPEPQAQAGETEWICPSCKVNRLKAPCLTPCGNCPMKGEAR